MCIARKSEITLNQSVVIYDYDIVAWVKRLSPDIVGRKLSSQRTEGIFCDLRTDSRENHDMRPRATNVDGGCYKVMSVCWNIKVSKGIRIEHKGDLADEISLWYGQQRRYIKSLTPNRVVVSP